MCPSSSWSGHMDLSVRASAARGGSHASRIPHKLTRTLYIHLPTYHNITPELPARWPTLQVQRGTFLCPREHAERTHIHIHCVSNGTITGTANRPGIAAPTAPTRMTDHGALFSRDCQNAEAQNRERRSQTLRRCNPVLPRLRPAPPPLLAYDRSAARLRPHVRPPR